MMPTMQEIEFDETVTWTVDEWKAYAKRLHGEWRETARRGVGADAEEKGLLADIERLGVECDAAQQRAEKAEAALAEAVRSKIK